jgi:tetratricopeptide (TPR) repeat protein
MNRTLGPVIALLLVLLPAHGEAQGVTSPYLQIVWRYRAGDTAGALVAAATLPTGGLRARVLRDLGPRVCETLGGTPDCDRLRQREPLLYRTRVAPILRAALPAAVLLHLHASTSLDVSDAPGRAEAHRDLARILIDRMAPVEADLDAAGAASLSDIRRRATLLFAWLLQSYLAVDTVGDYVRDALRAFPGDADLLLASGWVDETLARPMFLDQRYDRRSAQAAIASSGWRDRERLFRLARAAERYRQALAARPSLAEARVRLGRVLFLQGRVDEARPLLSRFGADADARARYLGALFAGGLEERAGETPAARRWYDAAVRAWPANQVARISLGRLLAHAGDRAGAAALVATLPGESDKLDQDSDPWSWYHLGQAWRLERAFLALREDLHR